MMEVRARLELGGSNSSTFRSGRGTGTCRCSRWSCRSLVARLPPVRTPSPLLLPSPTASCEGVDLDGVPGAQHNRDRRGADGGNAREVRGVGGDAKLRLRRTRGSTGGVVKTARTRRVRGREPGRAAVKRKGSAAWMRRQGFFSLLPVQGLRRTGVLHNRTGPEK